jgi:hypothetical protein
LLAAAGRVGDLLVGGGLHEHVARAAPGKPVVRIGGCGEPQPAPADLAHLLLDLVLRLGSIDELLHGVALCGGEVAALALGALSHVLYRIRERVCVSWHDWSCPSR